MAASRSKVLSLYKSMLRESQRFSAYNYRCYFLRKVQDEFRSHKLETDSNVIQQLILQAEENLQLIKRQVVIGQLYKTDPLVIEKSPQSNT